MSQRSSSRSRRRRHVRRRRRCRERFWRYRALAMQRLELRKGLVRVPAVLGEAEVRELVVKRRDLLQLQDERLLLVGLSGRRTSVNIKARRS